MERERYDHNQTPGSWQSAGDAARVIGAALAAGLVILCAVIGAIYMVHDHFDIVFRVFAGLAMACLAVAALGLRRSEPDTVTRWILIIMAVCLFGMAGKAWGVY